MTFVKQEYDISDEQVPGARWFKGDLHIHTLDDHSSGRVKLPSDVRKGDYSVDNVVRYARHFLKGAIANGVRVLGITPHSPKCDSGVSAVWHIVEEWNRGHDDDGNPFRSKIYAVFPGFEPKLKQGSRGLHLLFLFEPEIGEEKYLSAFNLVMGGRSPWDGNNLAVSGRTVSEALDDLHDFRKRESSGVGNEDSGWDFLALAPHIDGENGLLTEQKSQLLRDFPHHQIAGLELNDDKLPEDTVKNRSWIDKGMSKHYQAFFHSSDAYSISEIGRRHTWFKLATSRIGALRQAFIASDSRMRIGYERTSDGDLRKISSLTDSMLSARPWLKSVTVRGNASFFGNDDRSGIRFDFSPDLTCVIGGSMTGKSTLLDGLRVHIDARMPEQNDALRQVEARGREVFLAGSPKVVLDCPGQDPTVPLRDQWPAEFYTQSELRMLAQDSATIESILTRIVETERNGIDERTRRLIALDKELYRTAKLIAKLYDDRTEAEQALERSRNAADELAAFSAAGVDDMHRVSRESQRWQDLKESIDSVARKIGTESASASSIDFPETDAEMQGLLRDPSLKKHLARAREHWQHAQGHLRHAQEQAAVAVKDISFIVDELIDRESDIRVKVERELASRGLERGKMQQFQSLNAYASLLSRYEANFQSVNDRFIAAQSDFNKLLCDRDSLVCEQRAAFDRVMASVSESHNGRIRLKRNDDRILKPLDSFIRELKQTGITRWWNDLTDDERPAPQELIDKLDKNRLVDLKMSGAVQNTFRESISLSKGFELTAIRCNDQYVLELRMDDGEYRAMDSLSGGQRVSVLLSLLLETKDDRPLVIDQPEDELDNRFLFETLLPVLRRLKGRRQIIMATHSANIVVNGDADLVIQLEADANHGRIACMGTIEEPEVRNAIITTVDGGPEAFRLRRMKYGF